MSIISNENQHGSPFPEPEPQAPLPDTISYGEWRAVAGRYTKSGAIYWDLYRKNRRFVAIDGEMSPANLREIMRSLDLAYSVGQEQARYEIRQALGIAK